MNVSGVLSSGTPTCVCPRRIDSLRAPAAVRRTSSSVCLLRDDRIRRGRSATARKASFTTCVAAVEEEAPSAGQEAPSTSGEAQDPEFQFAMDFTRTEDLYKRFNELLDKQMMDVKLGDKVTGTVARCVLPAVVMLSEVSSQVYFAIH